MTQLLVQCQNAPYGTMVASLLYYQTFAKSLTDIGFVTNPYDSCVAHKMIDGKQRIICWHVNDLKVSHVRPKAVDRIVKYLSQEYKSIFEDGSGAISVSREKVHKYLGMDLDYSVRGQVKISVFDYIDEILSTALDKAEPKGADTRTSAAPANLFTVKKDCEKITSDKTVQFHNLMAKTLYSTKRVRPDICTSISFLMT